MPIYEYQCQQCGTHFELIRAYSQADSPAQCPRCTSIETKRKLSKVNAFSNGKSLTDSGPSCGSCSGGSCSTCGS
ncbi:MAG: zinc ribbon domain-containing protein [Chloroflexi bacterium]|jgi:putative FmdB family regulatory protein|nr:zinc ribbon domain-containing protein [Anaerolineaceae bacterium]NLI44174.1 zinc ribbon domain-containing protein [Chloroflexota bacterium]HOE34585.1 zinc ribbon domain-containing protein [Anaerolineaceae bacterium]HOT24891.1 zinc ribbon domain-containing protein [Anaerolineaceae bacterium]HQH58404.1 zinc ribbon domain-containing protein [Anaerolineaceae bacterium]